MQRQVIPAALLLGLLLGGCASAPLHGTAPATPALPALPPAAVAGSPSAATGAWTAEVAALASPDFVQRQRAAERLVTAGEAALPALGRAGDQRVRGVGGVPADTTAPVVEAILADLDFDRVRTHLAGPWPAVRRAAADDLGRRDRLGAVPDLIQRLEDEEVAVRMASVAALRRLTHRYFGFAPRGTAVARRGAAQRWNRWWNVEGRRAADREELPSG